MVTSQKIDENQMGNRGSKSDILINTMSVKEQRVYGICCNKNMQFRFTLMGLKRGYQNKFPSNQLIVQNLSYSRRGAHFKL